MLSSQSGSCLRLLNSRLSCKANTHASLVSPGNSDLSRTFCFRVMLQSNSRHLECERFFSFSWKVRVLLCFTITHTVHSPKSHSNVSHFCSVPLWFDASMPFAILVSMANSQTHTHTKFEVQQQRNWRSKQVQLGMTCCQLIMWVCVCACVLVVSRQVGRNKNITPINGRSDQLTADRCL